MPSISLNKKWVAKHRARRLAKPAKKAVVKLIRKELKAVQELKFLTVSNTFTIDATTAVEAPAAGLMSGIIQTLDDHGRIGNEIMVKSISYRFIASGMAAASESYIAFVRFKDCRGAAPTIAQIYLDATGALYPPTSIRNPDFLKDFQIVASKKLTLGSGGQTLKSFTLTHKFKGRGLKVRYDTAPGSGVVGDVEDNNIFIVAGCNGADDAVTVLGNLTVMYTDV